MTTHEPDGRHLDRLGLQQYLAAGAPSILKIDGDPALYFVVDPAEYSLRLRVPHARNKLPDVSAYKNISAEIIYWRDSQWSQLSINGPIIIDAYSVLIAVADRIQKFGAEFSAATRSALQAFRDVLELDARLGVEAEIGLFGEILVLSRLLEILPPQLALDSWRGHESEEHDFGLPEVDLEVKTTTRESRLHWINSLTQLRPTLSRPLYLASLQLTGAGADGLTINQLIARTEAALPETLRETLRSKLAAAGWRETTRALHTSRYHLRTKPQVFAVVDGFPMLTPESLPAAAGGGGIVQVRYMIDLSGVQSATQLPRPLADLAGGILAND